MCSDLFIVVGCGGIGYHLVEPLARYIQSDSIAGKIREYYGGSAEFKPQLVLIDGDIIEDKNTARVFSSNVIGQAKAYTLASQVHTLFPDMAISVVADYITSTKQFVETVKAFTKAQDHISRLHIFGCVDNVATRLLIENAVAWMTVSDASEAVLISYVDGGNSFDEGQAQIQLGGPMVPKVYDTSDPLVTPISSRRAGGTDVSSQEDRLPTERRCTQEYTSSPQLVFANGLASSLMLSLWYSTVATHWYGTHSIGDSYSLGHASDYMEKIHNPASEVNQLEFSMTSSRLTSSMERPPRKLTPEEFRAAAANCEVVG